MAKNPWISMGWSSQSPFKVYSNTKYQRIFCLYCFTPRLVPELHSLISKHIIRVFYDLKKGCQHFIRQGLLRLIIRDTSHNIQLSNTFLVFKPCLILLVSPTTIMNSQQSNSLTLNSMKQLISKNYINFTSNIDNFVFPFSIYLQPTFL